MFLTLIYSDSQCHGNRPAPKLMKAHSFLKGSSPSAGHVCNNTVDSHFQSQNIWPCWIYQAVKETAFCHPDVDRLCRCSSGLLSDTKTVSESATGHVQFFPLRLVAGLDVEPTLVNCDHAFECPFLPLLRRSMISVSRRVLQRTTHPWLRERKREGPA